jgi:hypothetical protein
MALDQVKGDIATAAGGPRDDSGPPFLLAALDGPRVERRL